MRTRACGYIYFAYTRRIAKGTRRATTDSRRRRLIDALSHGFLITISCDITLPGEITVNSLSAACVSRVFSVREERRETDSEATDETLGEARWWPRGALRVVETVVEILPRTRCECLFDRCIDDATWTCIRYELDGTARHQHGPLSRFDAGCVCYFKSPTRDSQRNRRAHHQLVSNATYYLAQSMS